VLAAVVLYAAVAVPGLVLLAEGSTAAGLALLVVGHLFVWLFGRWYRRRYSS
jgi:hypothetical protein